MLTFKSFILTVISSVAAWLIGKIIDKKSREIDDYDECFQFGFYASVFVGLLIMGGIGAIVFIMAFFGLMH